MWIRNRDLGIFLTRDPGWKKFGSGIKNPDPQHLNFECARDQTFKYNLKRFASKSAPKLYRGPWGYCFNVPDSHPHQIKK